MSSPHSCSAFDHDSSIATDYPVIDPSSLYISALDRSLGPDGLPGLHFETLRPGERDLDGVASLRNLTKTQFILKYTKDILRLLENGDSPVEYKPGAVIYQHRHISCKTLVDDLPESITSYAGSDDTTLEEGGWIAWRGPCTAHKLLAWMTNNAAKLGNSGRQVLRNVKDGARRCDIGGTIWIMPCKPTDLAVASAGSETAQGNVTEPTHITSRASRSSSRRSRIGSGGAKSYADQKRAGGGAEGSAAAGAAARGSDQSITLAGARAYTFDLPDKGDLTYVSKPGIKQPIKPYWLVRFAGTPEEEVYRERGGTDSLYEKVAINSLALAGVTRPNGIAVHPSLRDAVAQLEIDPASRSSHNISKDIVTGKGDAGGENDMQGEKDLADKQGPASGETSQIGSTSAAGGRTPKPKKLSRDAGVAGTSKLRGQKLQTAGAGEMAEQEAAAGTRNRADSLARRKQEDRKGEPITVVEPSTNAGSPVPPAAASNAAAATTDPIESEPVHIATSTSSEPVTSSVLDSNVAPGLVNAAATVAQGKLRSISSHNAGQEDRIAKAGKNAASAPLVESPRPTRGQTIGNDQGTSHPGVTAGSERDDGPELRRTTETRTASRMGTTDMTDTTDPMAEMKKLLEELSADPMYANMALGIIRNLHAGYKEGAIKTRRMMANHRAASSMWDDQREDLESRLTDVTLEKKALVEELCTTQRRLAPFEECFATLYSKEHRRALEDGHREISKRKRDDGDGDGSAEDEQGDREKSRPTTTKRK